MLSVLPAKGMIYPQKENIRKAHNCQHMCLQQIETKQIIENAQNKKKRDNKKLTTLCAILT